MKTTFTVICFYLFLLKIGYAQNTDENKNILTNSSIHEAENGTAMAVNNDVLYGKETLPLGIRSQIIDNNNGCQMHILEAGYETADRPLIVLLHGFPELAYSWRKQLLSLSKAGYHVIAPDLRGYGRSCGTGIGFEEDLKPYTVMNNVADIIGLVYAMGYSSVTTIIGHDYGSAIAANASLYRPDIFHSLILLSVPYSGPPSLPFNTVKNPINTKAVVPDIPKMLKNLSPPRKHYWWYYSSSDANQQILDNENGLSNFFRSYFHFKSGDFSGNQPFSMASWNANEMAKLPKGYIMDFDKNMAETVLPYMPTKEEIANNFWLTDLELNVYANEYKRTGFQGGAQAYRLITNPSYSYGLNLYTGKNIDVPTMFIAGKFDWGPYLTPGALEKMKTVCTRMQGVYFLNKGGHMIQQENPEEVNKLIFDFLLKINANK